MCHEPDFYNDVVDKVWNLEEYSLLSVSGDKMDAVNNTKEYAGGTISSLS